MYLPQENQGEPNIYLWHKAGIANVKLAYGRQLACPKHEAWRSVRVAESMVHYPDQWGS